MTPRQQRNSGFAIVLPPADQKFYFLAEGRLQKHTGWAEYDDHWFILKEGQPDTAQTGLVEYNGGTFAAAAGQVLLQSLRR